MLFFLIPAIVAATTTGLTVASEVTDGAIWYPDIDRYKKELVQEQKNNDILNNQMSNLIKQDQDLHNSYEQMDVKLGDLVNSITEIEEKAATDIFEDVT